jgi:hypothetical protein
MGYFDGLNTDEIRDMAFEDWRAARDSRRDLEEQKLDHYKLYRTFREELASDGDGNKQGPFGWSSLSVPLVFWIVETILPRAGTNLPTVNVRAKKPAAVPYAMATELRMRELWRSADIASELFMAIKSAIIMGEGMLKERWDRALGGPSAKYVPWFDFFISPEAANYQDAEYIVHRTWHTPRGIQELIKRDQNRIDETGKKIAPLYDREALEEAIHGAKRDSGADPVSQEIREASGLGSADYQNNGGQIALCEIHYHDGSMAVIAGDEQPWMVRHRAEPLWRDMHKRPLRPFTLLSNTPDLFHPYAISSVETIADFQHEITSLTNQTMDQATRNINAPKGIDDTMVDDVNEVIAAFGTPGGVFRTKGDPFNAVRMFPPGQMSQDYERMDASIRQQAQLVSGVSDIAAGQATAGGLNNETALGASILREESNMRFRLLLSLFERSVNKLVNDFHCMDRAMSTTNVAVKLPSSMEIPADAAGIHQLPYPGWAEIGPEVNGEGLEYLIEISAGSLAPPSQSEAAQKMRSLIQDILAFPPPNITGVTVDWEALMRRLMEAIGEDPEGIVRPWTPPPPDPMMGPPPDAGPAPLPDDAQVASPTGEPPLPPAAAPPEGA